MNEGTQVSVEDKKLRLCHVLPNCFACYVVAIVVVGGGSSGGGGVGGSGVIIVHFVEVVAP